MRLLSIGEHSDLAIFLHRSESKSTKSIRIDSPLLAEVNATACYSRVVHFEH